MLKSPNSRFKVGITDWVKIKKKDQSVFQVVYIDPVLERIEVRVITNEGLTAKRVGVKVVTKQKAKLKVGDWVTVEYYGILEGGSLRHPVFRGRKES